MMQDLTDMRRMYYNTVTWRKAFGIGELLDTRLTVNWWRFLDDENPPINETAFEEIRVVLPEQVFGEKTLRDLEGLDVGKLKISISEEEFCGRLTAVFKAAIEKRLLLKINAMDVFNIIFYTDSYFSRIFVFLLKEILKEQLECGNRILVKLFCMDNDIELFDEIMDHLGYEKEQRFYFQPNYDELLDFENAWRMANGCSDYPLNDFYCALKAWKDDVLNIFLPVRIWLCGYFTDIFENDFKTGGSIRERVSQCYHSREAQFLGALDPCDETVCPVFDLDMQKLMSGYGGKSERLMSCVLVRADRWLAELRQIRLTREKISDETRDRLISDFKGCQLAYHNVKAESLDKAAAWRKWTAGSLVEHVLNEGKVFVRF